MIYLLPSDVPSDATVALGMDRAIRHLQIWYQKEMGNGKTFAVANPAVQLIRSSYSTAYFATGSWGRATAEVFALERSRFYDSTAVWNIYLPVVTDGQGGAASVALLGNNDVLGITGRDPASPSVSRWDGGLGHEMGHAFGMPHPPGCDEGRITSDCNALMFYGYLTYPDTFLTPAEKQQLNASPFFTTAVSVTNALFDTRTPRVVPRP